MERGVDSDRESPVANFFGTFGAVPVGGKNFFALMRQGEAVLLFPGRVCEVRPQKLPLSSPRPLPDP